MRTAQDIIKKYQARGYSVESLRVLADSRDEPLRGEMLALLDGGFGPESRMEASASADDPVFFTVSEDESAETIDFDVMAETREEDAFYPAAGEESIAEIPIGETGGAVVAHIRETPSEEGKTGWNIWSRLWGSAEGMMLVSKNSAPMAGDLSETSADAQAPTDAPCVEACALDADPDPGQPESGMAGKAVGVDGGESGMTEPSGGSRESESMSEISDYAEHSSDYIPGTVSESYDPATEGTPEGDSPPINQSASVILASHPADSPDIPQKMELEPVLTPSPDQSGKLTRKERRRQERAEKKRQKREKSPTKPAGRDLPEIVLSAHDGTDALSTEFSLREFPMTVAGGDMKCASPEGVEASREDGEAPRALDDGAPPAVDDENEERAGPAAATENGLADTPGIAAESGSEPANVILFRSPSASLDEWPFDQEEESEQEHVLRLLSMDEDAEEEEEEASAAASDAVDLAGPDELPPFARLSLLRALAPSVPEWRDEDDAADAEHVIVTAEQPASSANAEEVAKALESAEREYQSRLDEFARRMLELQATVAEGKTRLTEKNVEIENRESLLRDAERKLQDCLADVRRLNRDLEAVRGEKTRADAELKRLEGVHGEHERLYKEYEDLRKSYNEVVEEVLPSLQNERDELALTVERQAEDEDGLRRKVKSADRRVAVGYSLAAAAAVIMVFLPLMHWMRAGELERGSAANLQELSAWKERAKALDEENQTVKSEMANMKMEMAQTNRKLEKLEGASSIVLRQVKQQPSDPVRMEDAASLSGPVGKDGRLRFNGVRDASGGIAEVFAQNTERYVSEDAQMASLQPKQRGPRSVQASAVIRTAPPSQAPVAASAVKPAVPERAKGEIATVKKGEGVAQVVYRVLGSRNPEIIDWVIRENNLKENKQGNPMIHPNQKLQLPASGHPVQAASAARRQ